VGIQKLKLNGENHDVPLQDNLQWNQCCIASKTHLISDPYPISVYIQTVLMDQYQYSYQIHQSMGANEHLMFISINGFSYSIFVAPT